MIGGRFDVDHSPLAHHRVGRERDGIAQEESDAADAQGPGEKEQDCRQRFEDAKHGQVSRVRTTGHPSGGRTTRAEHESESDVEENEAGPQPLVFGHGKFSSFRVNVLTSAQP
jgi:hypothetical protein